MWHSCKGELLVNSLIDSQVLYHVFLDNIIIINKKRQYEVKSTLFIDGGGYGYTAVSSLGAGKTL